MSHSARTRRRARTWAAAVAAATFAAVAACSGQPAEPAAPGPTYDPALHQRLPADIRASGTLAVATDATYPPATFFAPDGRTVVGFEPDLAAALGAVLGLRVEFVVTDFIQTLDDVRAGRADVVISAMTDTEERQREADFVNYFSAGTSILVQRGNPEAVSEIEDLCGHVVAVERGTVQVDLLHRSQPRCADTRIRVRELKTNADALVELRTGRATAVLNDYPPAVFLATDPRTQADYQLASTAQYEPGLYGIAIPKDEPQLRDALQAALERIHATGEYARILEDWDVAEGAVATITVNAG
jgi:polar amino acid transport system substrate-binding protein